MIPSDIEMTRVCVVMSNTRNNSDNDKNGIGKVWKKARSYLRTALLGSSVLRLWSYKFKANVTLGN